MLCNFDCFPITFLALMKNRKSTGLIVIAGLVATLLLFASIHSVPTVEGNLPLEEQPYSWRHVLPLMLAYIGPDPLIPFMSAIAAGVGFVLMFWQRLVEWVRRLWSRVFRRARAPKA